MGATYDDVMTALGVFGTGVFFGAIVIVFMGQAVTFLGVLREWIGL